MKQSCKCKIGPDIVDVVEGLGVDVNNALSTGIIEDKSASVFHNELKEFGEIGIVARDPFDIIDYDRAYSKFRKRIENLEKEKDSK